MQQYNPLRSLIDGARINQQRYEMERGQRVRACGETAERNFQRLNDALLREPDLADKLTMLRDYESTNGIQPWESTLRGLSRLVISDAEQVERQLDYIGQQQVRGCARTP